MPAQEVPRVPETINFSDEEKIILEYWKKIDVFQTCLKQSKGKPRFSFYDGPPFATGMPHYGHILAGTVKDVVTRYAHQQGFHVERRFGWDCHGLPVEYEIDKALDIKGPEDVMKMGIDKYNAECRKIVMRYSKEWEIIMGRIGRWIDFVNDYKTMYPTFMESIWWVFRQLYDKGLVYKGYKVMPYSTACNTPLSNFESGQNYKDVVDPSVTVSFPLIDDKDQSAVLIWTTTPWTLPSNLAACVHPTIKYALFEQLSTNKRYIMAESRIAAIFNEDYKILKSFPGSELKGRRYQPPFNYFSHFQDRAFRILVDEYVSEESGTGVVHQAPYFGEDDYRISLNAGIITKDSEVVCPLDSKGVFVKPVTDFEGMYVKDADKKIIADLKSRGLLVHQSQTKHSYPFCWRSDTPLIYRAVPSWFVSVEQMVEELLKASSDTYWVPDFVKEKRFGNWLRDARDWAVSRNRYWGTPIPIWTNGEESICIGSIAELEERTGQKITDLHRESIDHLEIPATIPGSPPLKRVSEVFDCWFESGSMPYAQKHYPFESVKEFDESFPADFIAEGIDQTRGWFYTLLVISTALFGKAPYKNLIASGLILANDGQKMSKRKKNYPDPMDVVAKYGADALRLYLISSPVVRAENLRFQEEGVRDVLKDVFLPWYNAFRFLLQNVENYVKENDLEFYYVEGGFTATNTMDQWILSFTQSLLAHVRKEMGLYHLYNVVPRLTKYIDYLTNWYVRMNRKRLKGDGGVEDCKTALLTLFEVLLNIVKMMSPFAPFLSERMYLDLKKLMAGPVDSVHYVMLPEANEALINEDIERAVARMQSVIELGRIARDRKTIPIKYPLPEVVVVHQDSQYLADILSLTEYILLELNVRNIQTTTDTNKYGITLRAEPDYRLLGGRFKHDLKTVTAGIQALTDPEIKEMIKVGHKVIAGQHINFSEIKLVFKSDSVTTTQYEVIGDKEVVILLNTTPDKAMQDEGTAREIINRIQKLRKKAHLVPTDKISVFYEASGEIDRVAKSYSEFIENTIKVKFLPLAEKQANDSDITSETHKLKNCDLQLVLAKYKNIIIPKCKWANLKLIDIKPRFCNSPTATVLLEGPTGPISLSNLRNEVFTLFGVEHFNLIKQTGMVVRNEDILDLSTATVYVVPVNKTVTIPQEGSGDPFCTVFNFSEGNMSGTIILENPAGSETLREDDYKTIINAWLKANKKSEAH